MKKLCFLLLIYFGSYHTVSLSDTCVSPANEMNLLGSARLRVFGFSIYESRLYSTETYFSELHRPLVLEIFYNRSISKERLLKQTLKEWRALGVSQSNRAAWGKTLSDSFVDVKKGDSIAFKLEQSKGVLFVNYCLHAEIYDVELAQAFLNIWVGERTTRPKLAAQLKGVIN